MKTAAITKNKHNIWINSKSQTTDGLWVASTPFIKLNLDISTETLLEDLLMALNQSKLNVPHPRNWTEFNKQYLAQLGVKSLKSVYKDAIACSVSEHDQHISFLPTKRVGDRGRFDYLPEYETKVPVSSGKAEICKALEGALLKCI